MQTNADPFKSSSSCCQAKCAWEITDGRDRLTSGEHSHRSENAAAQTSLLCVWSAAPTDAFLSAWRLAPRSPAGCHLALSLCRRNARRMQPILHTLRRLEICPRVAPVHKPIPVEPNPELIVCWNHGCYASGTKNGAAVRRAGHFRA